MRAFQNNKYPENWSQVLSSNKSDFVIMLFKFKFNKERSKREVNVKLREIKYYQSKSHWDEGVSDEVNII